MKNTFSRPVKSVENEKELVTIFSPNSGIWKHKIPELIIAKSFDTDDSDIEFIHCSVIYDDYCLTMSAFGTQYYSDIRDKKAICQKCISTKSFVEDIFSGIRMTSIEDLINIKDLTEVQSIVDSFDIDNWHKFQIGGILIGRISAYELLLHHKITGYSLPDFVHDEYRSALKNSLITFYAAHNYFTNRRGGSVYVYNRLYSINNIFCRVAESYGARTFSIDAGGYIDDVYSRYLIFRDDSQILDLNTSEGWHNFRTRPLTSKEITSVVVHVRHLFKGESPWVYSVPLRGSGIAELKSKIGILNHQKVVLAAMSSNDEIFAANLVGASRFDLVNSKYATFASYIDWIDHLVQIANRRQDLFFIIRVHPREFPNKRETMLSQHAKDFMNYFDKTLIPKNVLINYPSQNISLYDLLPITDLICNTNSSSGMEYALFGIPIIVHNPDLLTAFPKELAHLVYESHEYESTIDAALKNGKTLDQSILAFRWYNYRFNITPINFMGFKNRIIFFLLSGFKKYEMNKIEIIRIMVTVLARRVSSISIDGEDFIESKSIKNIDIPTVSNHSSRAGKNEARRVSRAVKQLSKYLKFEPELM